MLALGIGLVIAGFLLLPRGGIGGPGRDRRIDDDPPQRPDRSRAVARGLLAFAILAAGAVCIAIGS